MSGQFLNSDILNDLVEYMGDVERYIKHGFAKKTSVVSQLRAKHLLTHEQAIFIEALIDLIISLDKNEIKIRISKLKKLLCCN